MIYLPFLDELKHNLQTTPEFIQVILGPRQVGKTTGISLFLEKYRHSFYEVSGDDFRGDPYFWFQEQLQKAFEMGERPLLVIDEIQKIPEWSTYIKGLWDKERRKRSGLKLVLLGSSSLGLQQGLTESLTGRFQLIRAYHWNFSDSQKLKKMNLPEYLRFGGYPGSYSLIKNPKAWKSYLQESIIDTVIGKDILMQARVKNPALFRQAFILLSGLPAQEISYTKLLGQLQDRGNTDLIKHYIELFEGAYLFKSIPKYSPKALKLRSSSPKIIPLCTALIDRLVFSQQSELGRVFEAAVGASLLRAYPEIFYWRDGDYEIDFVIESDTNLIAIEVKSGRNKKSKSLPEFLKKYPKSKVVFISPENFEKFDKDPQSFIKAHS